MGAWYGERHDPPVAPQFFTTDIPATLAYYKDKLGFDCVSTGRIRPSMRSSPATSTESTSAAPRPPTPNADKYADELLDAYLFIDDADALYAELAARSVEFTRGLADTPWDSREFVVKDCDGRLLAFGANPE